MYTSISTIYTTVSTIYTTISTARCVLPTPLTTSPSPGVRCTTRAATATRRTRSPPAPGTRGHKYFSYSFKYFYASALLQVCDVQVSAVQVRLQPAGRGPGLLLLRGRRVQGGRHLLIYNEHIYISSYLYLPRTVCASPATRRAARVTHTPRTRTPAAPASRPANSASVSVSGS